MEKYTHYVEKILACRIKSKKEECASDEKLKKESAWCAGVCFDCFGTQVFKSFILKMSKFKSHIFCFWFQLIGERTNEARKNNDVKLEFNQIRTKPTQLMLIMPHNPFFKRRRTFEYLYKCWLLNPKQSSYK